MILAIDFDGTLVEQYDHPYDDLESPLKLMPGAREALGALRRAGHTLILFSGRANRALRFDPDLAEPIRKKSPNWATNATLNQARYQQMLDFVEAELPGVFAAIDSGAQGKPSVDLFIDDKALRFGEGAGCSNWADIAASYGEELPPEAAVDWAQRAAWLGAIDRLVSEYEFPGELGVLGAAGDCRVRLVDSSAVMLRYSMDFTEGGHHFAFDFIPADEIWLYAGLPAGEARFVLYHELIERLLMMERGFGYETAHAVANEYERELRREAAA